MNTQTRALLLSLALSAGAAAQSTLVLDLSPFTPFGVVGEVLGVGTQSVTVTSARMDVTYESFDSGPWLIGVSFGLPTGVVGVDSETQGWAGAGTFTASIVTPALNGVLAPPDGQPFWSWFLSWSGGKPGTSSGGFTTLEPVDGVFTQLKLTLSVTPGPFGTWADLGHALAGTLGEPLLQGSGNLCRSAPGELLLLGAKPGGSTWLVVGLSELSAPFKGGLLVPSLDAVLVLAVDPTGTCSLPFVFPIGVPMGTQIWFQHWIPDPAGVAGFAASNALLATVPSDC